MVYFIISGVILVLFFILFGMMVKGFKNPQRKHSKTPSEIDLDFEEVSILTLNNKKLYGWLFRKNPASPTIILVHGWGRNVERMMPYIEQLSKNGYNLLTFDARHHGNSDEDKHSTMKKFAEDIIASINFIVNQTEISNSNFGLIGLSIGGGASIYPSAHDQRIKSVITVGAFANPLEIMRFQLKSNHIPYKPLGWLLLKYLEKKVGFKFNDIAPEKHIKNSDAKFLLIHGKRDETIPVSHLHRLAKAGKKENIETWEMSDKGHSDCHFEDGFWRKIKSFLNDSLT
jgi:pimeloyl-ACP methyl ester carboxylesterase